jgi:hypothetical protein
VALLEKRRFLYNHSGDFPQVILIVPSHVPNNSDIKQSTLQPTAITHKDARSPAKTNSRHGPNYNQHQQHTTTPGNQQEHPPTATTNKLKRKKIKTVPAICFGYDTLYSFIAINEQRRQKVVFIVQLYKPDLASHLVHSNPPASQ